MDCSKCCAGTGFSSEVPRGLAAGTILKPSTVTETWTDWGNGYGYGWIPDHEKGRKSIGHNGRIDGYAASFRLFQDEDLFIAVLSNVNGTNTERMISALAAIAHGEPLKDAARTDVYHGPRPTHCNTMTAATNCPGDWCWSSRMKVINSSGEPSRKRSPRSGRPNQQPNSTFLQRTSRLI
jgi:hypothetical protein